jgi:hypothetical protein
MKLIREQSQKLLRECGVWITEACDKCGKLLGPVRWTVRGESGAWCSRKCRDGVDHQPGVCRGCGTTLAGKRRGTMYCGRTCRMRKVRKEVQDRANIVNTPIQDKGLTEAISRFGCGSTKEQARRDQQLLEARDLRTSTHRNKELQCWSRPPL